MKEILVLAYQLHYSNGSECAVAMDYLRHMSVDNKLTVLYGSCNGYHMIGDTSEMEEWCAANPMKNVTFIPVKPSFKSGWYGYSVIGNMLFYREYRRWHKDAARVAERLIVEHHFDLIHYLGPIGYREPGYLRELGLPMVWGPIGGFGTVNPHLAKACFSFSGAALLYIKSFLNVIQYSTSRRVHKALRDTDVVICATMEYLEKVRVLAGPGHHSAILYRPENCIDKLSDLNEAKFDDPCLEIVFVGRLDSGKALLLALEGLKKVPKDADVRLHVVGSGPLEAKYRRWAGANGIEERVVWHGRIPRNEVFAIMDSSHIMLMPSLYDANTTVIWEAMSMGLPTLALDHCGFHDTVIDGSTGILVSPQSYGTAVKGFADAITKLSSDRESLRRMAHAVLEDRNRHTWDERCAFFNEIYNLAIERHQTR